VIVSVLSTSPLRVGSDQSSVTAGARRSRCGRARGETVIDPELVARLVARRRERDPLDELTDRERAVLALMAQGLSNAAVAA
jgi:DNA-binding NarL/FixJ family response regulator